MALLWTVLIFLTLQTGHKNWHLWKFSVNIHHCTSIWVTLGRAISYVSTRKQCNQQITCRTMTLPHAGRSFISKHLTRGKTPHVAHNCRLQTNPKTQLWAQIAHTAQRQQNLDLPRTWLEEPFTADAFVKPDRSCSFSARKTVISFSRAVTSSRKWWELA